MDSPSTTQPHEDDTLDVSAVMRRLRNALPQTVGLALLGLAVAAVGYFASGPFQTVATSTRVIFSFSGFERGEYPDKSKFQPDDLRSPEVIAEALKRQRIDSTEDFQGKIRAALSVEGIIPDSIAKERDRLRATGQTPRPYIPDEYIVTLSLPRKFPIAPRQRELLLNEVVSVYQEKFARTYVALPLGFGKAFESLVGADYFDYELVLRRESENIASFLTDMVQSARAFRSPRSNLSFNDLMMQSQLFTQIRLNEVLGLIQKYGLSKDRKLAMVKVDYYLKTLGDAENKAMEEEKVVQALLKQANDRFQGYALGVKSQAGQPRSDSVVVDQGLVDSLLANDAYNFLVRQALEASLKTRRIQSDKAVLQERRDNMEAFLKSDEPASHAALAQFQKSLDELKVIYDNLIVNMRITYEDFQHQQYADAIRISTQTRSESFYRGFAVAGIVGFLIGATVSVALTLVGVDFGQRKRG